MARNDDDASTAGDSGTATTTPKKTSTHITPFNSITELTPAKYLAFWDNCTATPATWTPVKVSPENRMAFVDALRDWAETYNIAVFQIPTEGDGTIEATARVVAGKDYANYKLSKFTDILDDHNTQLKDKQPVKFSRWIFGDDTQTFAVKDDDKMISKVIDPDAAGNVGLVNKEKLKLRRESAMAYAFLRNLLTFEEFKPFRLLKKDFTYKVEEDPRNVVRCGLVLWTLMCEIMFPDVKISTEALENEMKALTLASFQNDLPAFFRKMEDYRLRIEAEKGVPYDKDTFTTLLLDRIEVYKQPDFASDVRAARRDWTAGRIDTAQIIKLLSTTYNNLVVKKTWTKIDPSAEQLIALATGLKDSKKKNNSSKSSSGHSNKVDRSAPLKGFGAPKWQWTYVGATRKHPDDGYEMSWCDKHRSPCGKAKGLYMKAPHNHDEWKAAKKKRQADFEAKQAAWKKKKSDDDNKSAPSLPSTSGTSKKKFDKLALSKSMQSAFCTNFMVDADDAKGLVDKVMAQYDSDSSN